ncbi:MAG: M3 family oligoendopeptidase, partial [Acidobacteriota bacterium]
KAADMGDWSQIEPLFTALLQRNVPSAEELARWLLDYSELSAALNEEMAKRYIAMTTQTDDPVREAAYQKFVEQIDPKSKPLVQSLEKAYLQNPHRKSLPAERYAVMNRIIESNVALFREENVPLEMQEALQTKEYQKLSGAMTVMVDGEERTLQQAAKSLEDPDRRVRQQVWEAMAGRRLQEKEKLERLYEQLLALRKQIAANAGFADYRAYSFQQHQRFDYGPEECFQFHDAVERAVLPLVQKIHTERRKLLQVETLRPWDLGTDPLNRPPLRPFSTTDELVQGTREIFTRVDPALGEQFGFMAEKRLLELESRKGKAPGGYQETLQERRWPFIFMNAVGRDLDIRTLLHEGGHAFHMLAAREEPLIQYRHAPMEFCEVASMSMELLATPHLDVFYKNPEDRNRAYRAKLEDFILIFPWIATIDAFQHWVYTHPDQTRDERAQAWRQIHGRFSAVVDWSGYEEQRTYLWHRQLHLYEVPFYYIEYGIALTGALQVWMRSRTDYRDAVERYWAALSLGGTRPLPELFAAAGVRFSFDYETLKPLMDAVGEELSRIGN